MYALRASDGHTLWRQKWINCGATVIADGEVITIRATIQALDAATGRTLWQPSATPTVGLLYLSGGHAGVAAFRLP